MCAENKNAAVSPHPEQKKIRAALFGPRTQIPFILGSAYSNSIYSIMDSVITSDAPAPSAEVASAAKRAKRQDEEAFASLPVVEFVPWSTYMSDLFIVAPSAISEEGIKTLERIPVHRVQLAILPFFQRRLTGSWASASGASKNDNDNNNIDCSGLEHSTSTWIACLQRVYKINPFFTDAEDLFQQFDWTFDDDDGPPCEMALFAYLLGEDIPSMVLKCIKVGGSQALTAVASAFVETHSALDLESLQSFKRIYDAAVATQEVYYLLKCFVLACTEKSEHYMKQFGSGGSGPEDVEILPPMMNLIRWLLILCGLAPSDHSAVKTFMERFDKEVASKFQSKQLQDLNMAMWCFKPCCSHFLRSDSNAAELKHKMLEAESAIYAGSPSHVVIPDAPHEFWTFVLEDVVFEGPCCLRSARPTTESNVVWPFGSTKNLPIFQVFKVQHRYTRGLKISAMPEYMVYCNSYSLVFV